MALVINDRVRETTTVTGTGTATLLGAVTGYQSFSVIGNGNTTFYTIADQVGPNWEVGIGTWSTGNTLARTTVLSSSNGGSLTNFTSGTKDVFCTYPSENAVFKDSNSNISANSFIPGWASTATAAGTTTLTVASAYYQRFTGTTTQTVVLPSATTVALGQGFIIDNDSSGTVTLQDGSLTPITTIVSGMAGFIFCENNGSTAGSWSGYQFVPGAGPSGAVTWGTAGLVMGGGALSGVSTATVTTSATVPTIYGGTTASSTLTIQSTSGAGTTDSIALKVGNAGAVTALSAATTGIVSFPTTGAVLLPKGTTAQEPTGVAGYLRFNTDTSQFEGYNGTAWSSVGGSAISNDTSTASNLYPIFVTATSGTALNVYTSNAKYLYKPSTGELQAPELIANNGLILNATTISNSYVIPSGNNAMSVGPITIATGKSVTVSSGQRWIVM